MIVVYAPTRIVAIVARAVTEERSLPLGIVEITNNEPDIRSNAVAISRIDFALISL